LPGMDQLDPVAAHRLWQARERQLEDATHLRDEAPAQPMGTRRSARRRAGRVPSRPTGDRQRGRLDRDRLRSRTTLEGSRVPGARRPDRNRPSRIAASFISMNSSSS
jgi:hypothetical protein